VELVETHWTLTEVDGQAVPPVEGGRGPHLFLVREHARVRGFAGCNTLSGGYTLSSGDGLVFGPLAMTRMACVSPAASAVEGAFVKGLEQVAWFKVTGTVLELRDRQGEARIRMQAVTPD
jgi:copper homeostasis protein (lipoprotein)